jgi:hypothetical protein
MEMSRGESAKAQQWPVGMHCILISTCLHLAALVSHREMGKGTE